MYQTKAKKSAKHDKTYYSYKLQEKDQILSL